ncbi:MAG: 30S ribosomal protein S12 methylthiotransferase RimO [Eubacteriales bacterium]
MTYSVGLISLGCAKNLVDSEVMLGLLDAQHYNIIEELDKADVLIVNTCGFIDAAKSESIETILELAKYKKHGVLKTLIATGCLSERYREALMKEIPELDAVIGTGDYEDILQVIEKTLKGEKIISYGHIHRIFDETLPRKRSTPDYTAFVKIGDGCNNHCSYCIIPSLRGKFRSRRIEDIQKEVKHLVHQGVKEIIIVAQDITQYGIDIYGKYSLADLLNTLDAVEGLKWIRLLYTYPENIDDALISVIKNSNHILPYLDIPLQHTEDDVLKKMARKTKKDSIINLIERLRREIPDIVIRSSFITGFPGETEENFQHMLETLQTLKIDRLGVFPYSQEEGTKAATFNHQISDETKQHRQDEILKMQQEISLNRNQLMIGMTLEILIEGVTDDQHVFYGRSYMDAPEIDGLVYVHWDSILKPGDFCMVKITDALEYDLIGERTDELTQ